MKHYVCPICSDLVDGDEMTFVYHFIKHHEYEQTTVEALNKRLQAFACKIDDFEVKKNIQG